MRVPSEHEIDIFLTNHEKSHGINSTYSGLLSFCISDVAKPLLLHNPNFIPHLVRLRPLSACPLSACFAQSIALPAGHITRDMIYSMSTVAVASKLDKLVGLSAAMAGDAAFARQARRKFL